MEAITNISLITEKEVWDMIKAHIRASLAFILQIGFFVCIVILDISGNLFWLKPSHWPILETIVFNIFLQTGVLFLLIYIPYIWIWKSFKLYKRNPDLQKTPYEYEFLTDRYKVAKHNQKVNLIIEHFYSAVMKAFESKDNFFIYQFDGINVVRKDGFISGSADKLRSILTNRLGDRFKVSRFIKGRKHARKDLKFPIPEHLQACSSVMPDSGETRAHLKYGTGRPFDHQGTYVYVTEDSAYVEVVENPNKRRIVVFDSNEHGWDGFVCQLKRPHGEPEIFVCKTCGDDLFDLDIQISSQGKLDFVKESGLVKADGTRLAQSDWVNAFDWITIEAVCRKCGSASVISDFETA